MSDDFQNAVLAAAQASGLVASDPDPDVSAADADPAAFEGDAPEPEDAPSPDDALALDEDDADEDAAFDADDESDEEPATESEWERKYRELAERQTRMDAERLRAEQEQARVQWTQAEANLQGWLQRSMTTLEQRAIQDELTARESDDPQRMRAYLHQARERDKQWVWAQYRSQQQVYDTQKHGATMAALAQSHLRQFAEDTAARYGLPRSAADSLMTYMDGTPVHPDAIPSRAAELVELRRERRRLQRTANQAQRTQGAANLPRVPAPGSGQPQGVPEFKSWRDGMAWAAEQYGLKP